MTFNVKIDKKQLSQAQRQIQNLTDKLKQCAGDSLCAGANRLQDYWQSNGLWEDTGALRKSGYVECAEVDDGFGAEAHTGFVAPYTVIQEERHPSNPNYLDNTYAAALSDIQQEIDNQFVRCLEGQNVDRRYPNFADAQNNFERALDENIENGDF